MKLVSFNVDTPVGRLNRLGVLMDGQEGGIADLTSTFAAYLASETDETMPYELANLRTPPDMIGWLRGGHKSRQALDKAMAYLQKRLAKDSALLGPKRERLLFNRSEVRLLAPLPRPRSIRDFGVFEDHYSRAGMGYEKKSPIWYRWPPYYKGNPDSVIGPEDPIPFPYYTKKLDLELEIAIVIGREGRNLTFEQARDHIGGYTIFIDCSARDGFEREPFGPTKRKDFCNVLGPCLVTADAIDEANLNVRVIVDGETWFEGNTGHRRSFLAYHLVAYVSDNETLYPGDILGTGAIGLSCSMDLHRWVNVGQTVTFEVEGIGSLTHKIIEGERVVDYTLKGMEGLLKPPSLES